MRTSMIAFIIAIFIMAGLVSAIDWSPQGNVNLKNKYNITNWAIGNCSSADEVVIGIDSLGIWVCSAAAGDVTGINTDGQYLDGGCSSGTCNLTVNETNLNATIESISTATNTSLKAYVDSQDIVFNDSMKDYADGKFIDSADEGNLNVNSSDYWDSYDIPTDLNNLLTLDWANITNKFITAVDDIYIYMSGTTVTLNETKLNETIIDIDTATNTSLKAYVDSQDTVYNDSLKLYVDSQDTTYNTSLKAYVDSQDVVYNDSMKTYVDSQDTVYNDSLKSYVDSQDLSYNSSITSYIDLRDTAFNDSMKTYVDSQDTVYNDSMKTYVDSQDTAFNTSLKEYADGTFITQANEGNLNVNHSNSTDYWDDIDTPDDFVNITLSGIIKGQPMTGSIGSGVITCSENLGHCGCSNITINSDLEVHYPEFEMRVVKTDGTEIHCSISEGDINVTDNQHSTYYLNSSCEWNSATFVNFHNEDMHPGGRARIFDVLAVNGVVEEVKGNTLLYLAKDKSEQVRIFCPSTSHLTVCNGFDITQDTFPSFNVSSGNSVYLNTYLPSDAKSTLIDETHLTHHENGNWTHTNVTGFNITHCDNGTDLVECTGTAFRQYPVYSISWNSDAIIHMLSPLTSGTTYTALSACKEGTPDYTLPDMEEYVGIVHHIYCARRTASVWDPNAWVDLRVAPVGAGGSPDLSIYLVEDGTRPLTANWDVGNYNITAQEFIADSWSDVSIIESQISDFGTYRLESWDNFTGIPTATPSDGDTTHLSTADQIRDYIIGLGYSTTTGTVTSVATTAPIAGGAITTTGTISLTACSDTEIYKYNSTSSAWECEADESGGTYYWNLTADSGTVQKIDNTNIVDIAGGTNGIDTVVGTTDTVTINLDWTEVANDAIAEAKIEFTTACSAGDYYRLTGNDLECTTPTDTTYSAGNGISEAATVFSVSGNTALTQDADGLSVTANGITDTQLAYNTGQHLTTTSTPEFATLSTGQGQYELYAMNQDVENTDAVTFATVNTGNGAYELFAMNQDVESTDGVTFATVDTGNGAYELFAMNQDVESTDAVTFATIETGQGANELYDMNQNVLTTSDPTFNNVTVETVKFEVDTANHRIYDNATCIFIVAGTTTLEICE